MLVAANRLFKFAFDQQQVGIDFMGSGKIRVRLEGFGHIGMGGLQIFGRDVRLSV